MRSSFSTPAEAVAALQGQATELLAGRQRVRALEAGAGKRTRLGLPEDAYIVGVDTDAAALAHNEQLSERVLCDLAAYAPAEGTLRRCHQLVCPRARRRPPSDTRLVRAVGSTGRAHRDRGAKPDQPEGADHKVHAAQVPHLVPLAGTGFSQCGQAGIRALPTTLRRSIAPKTLRRWASNRGLEVIFEGYFEDEKQLTVRKRLR
jgi:hypothetical protein